MNLEIDPPWRLDPLQNIVNVNWGGVYALVQVIAGSAPWGFATMFNSNGDLVGSTLSFSSPNVILYQRVRAFVDDAHTFQFVSVYSTTEPGGGGDHIDFEQFGIVVAPGLGGNWNIGHTTFLHDFLATFAADDAAGISAYLASIPPEYGGTTFEYTLYQQTVEAVLLLDNAKDFTISCDGFGMGISVYLYPKKGIKVDTSNATWGIFADPPNGRVYFPINWKSPPPPYPLTPDGVEWAGNSSVGGSSANTDVINATLWQISYSVNGDSGSYPLSVAKVAHLSAPPDPDDKNRRDKIWESYPTAVNGGAGDTWSVADYTDVPYGTLFNPPVSWFSITAPGPAPLIVVDT